MANQRRTSEPPVIVETLGGVNQVLDQLNLPPESTPWLHGMFPNARGDLERIPGKLANSTGSLGSHVLSLTQLEFSGKSVVLIHQGSQLKTEDDVTTLMTTPGSPFDSPVHPLIFK